MVSQLTAIEDSEYDGSHDEAAVGTHSPGISGLSGRPLCGGLGRTASEDRRPGILQRAGGAVPEASAQRPEGGIRLYGDGRAALRALTVSPLVRDPVLVAGKA